MSATVYIRDRQGTVYDIELRGSDTLAAFYRMVGERVGLAAGSFDLRESGQEAVLDNSGEPVAKAGIFEGQEYLITEAVEEVVVMGVSGLLAREKELCEIFTKDPSYVLVLDATEMVDGGIMDLSSLGHILPPCIGNIVITSTADVTMIGHNFMNHARHIKKAVLMGVSGVTVIDSYFMKGCSSLVELDISDMRKVNDVGDGFLAGCTALEAIDLSCLQGVQSIGSNFLSNCFMLREIDLTPLTSLTTVGDQFLLNCSSLTSVTTAPLCSLATAGSHFLALCHSLQHVDLSGLRNLTDLGPALLHGCTSLVTCTAQYPLPQVVSKQVQHIQCQRRVEEDVQN
eukprot:TRINITY_DN47426_c0_g1_i1.p1 TRINITY_DN47426_c0_g1~~TRINITY_DN47426_c0_g1_i1.p1  ORF type:complete len:349 (+),score=56.89 TRINITY_DN47426_c0_g1_i1:22-1047(+)